MDLGSFKFEPLRPDAHRFISGVLWLTAVAVLALSPASVADFLRFVDGSAALLGHITVPSFVVGFLAVIAGVVVPYCLSEVFTPLSYLIMNLTLQLQHWLKPFDGRLRTQASEAVNRDLHLPFNTTHDQRVTYLGLCIPQVAADIRHRRDQLEFQASAILPASVLLGWFSYHIVFPFVSSTLAHILAYASGAAVFATAAYGANRTLVRLQLHVELAAYVAAQHGGLSRSPLLIPRPAP